jgi:hypothetical protein
MDDRRKHIRCDLTNGFQVFDRKTGEFIGRVGNVSQDGIMVVTKQRVEAGAHLECRMVFPEEVMGTNQMVFDAQVKWCNTGLDVETYYVGLQLRNMTPDEIDTISLLLKDAVSQG